MSPSEPYCLCLDMGHTGLCLKVFMGQGHAQSGVALGWLATVFCPDKASFVSSSPEPFGWGCVICAALSTVLS